MKGSFRNRLFAAFLIVSLIPLAVSSALMLQVFRLRMTGATEREAQAYLENARAALDTAANGFERVRDDLRASAVLRAALGGASVSSVRVYDELYRATEGLRGYASFDIYDADGTFRWSTQSLRRADALPTDWGALHAAADGGGAIRYLPCEEADADALLRGAAALHGGNGDILGYLVIQMYDAHFRALFEGRYGAQNDLLLLSPYWHGVYATDAGLTGTLAPALRERLLRGAALGSPDDPFLYTAARQDTTGFYLILRQPAVLTRSTMRLLYTVAATSALICVLISVLMSLSYSRQISRPIRRLEQAFSRLERNDLDARVASGRETDELSRLGTQFNGMVEALARNQEALLKNQRELDSTQIRMLQSQLNPHFLGNTLDTMKWISKINKVPQVAAMSADLADILRFGISPEELVPLRRETEILERYIEIQKIRLSDGFSFTLDVPAELEDCLVPKMILQPLVENAILHGLEGVRDGCVSVTARQTENGMLRVRVADNGRGFPAELLGAYRERGETLARGHLGLYNVDMILRKYYGEGSGLYLEAPAAGGGAVTAALPLKREEDEDEC